MELDGCQIDADSCLVGVYLKNVLPLPPKTISHNPGSEWGYTHLVHGAKEVDYHRHATNSLFSHLQEAIHTSRECVRY
jgi:hypothetical protein